MYVIHYLFLFPFVLLQSYVSYVFKHFLLSILGAFHQKIFQKYHKTLLMRKTFFLNWIQFFEIHHNVIFFPPSNMIKYYKVDASLSIRTLESMYHMIIIIANNSVGYYNYILKTSHYYASLHSIMIMLMVHNVYHKNCSDISFFSPHIRCYFNSITYCITILVHSCFI